ncbi:phosphotransferase family protein [Lentzea sp. CA-135723]|uniref:phosphotransferase family protein n=1 Tax=Lentzea sp. CA-135723 TaxID=3239950 RepID=UPI003D8E8DEA
MSSRLDWQELPADVRKAVEDRTGLVRNAESASVGRNSAFAASLHTTDGPVFCKGGPTDSPQAVMHRNEAEVNPFLPAELAPRLLWRVEQDGWLLLGFEHVSGRHADLSPGSPDLPFVASAIEKIGTVQPPAARRMIADHWEAALANEPANEWAARAPRHMRGATLVHSDLNPLNILVSDTARVVDWAWWRIGAAWIDPAFTVVRLVAEGHSPRQAEEWAAQFEEFRKAPAEAVTAFAASLVCLWGRKFTHTAATEAARTWTEHRKANGPRLR